MRFFPFFLLIFLSLSGAAIAQISDDFSDGNITLNPMWSGDVSNFTVNAAGKLQLNAPGAATSALTVRGNIPDNAEWSLHIRLDFAPSNQNLARIYLLADQADLNAANAYFLQLGETGSLDAIRLFRQTGAVKTELAAGTPGLIANAPVDLNVRVSHTINGVWTVEATPVGQAMQQQFTVTDAALGGGCDRYFGIQCLNTATNKDKFVFDDLNIRATIADTAPPVLLSAQAVNANEVTAVFSEILDSVSAVNPAHYLIDKGIGQPQKVEWLTGKKSVKLTLSKSLGNGSFTVQTNMISDCTGNISGVQNAGFQFFKFDIAGEFDILINEIYPDISPSAGLPATEWVELYNRSTKTINLSSLAFSDVSSSPQTLPAYTLEPDSFVVLCTTSGATSLRTITHRVLPVSSFPSLNDAGDTPTLSDAAGNIIDRVSFSSTWHTEAGKDGGGWSLERIDTGKPCIGAKNWQSCAVLPGGTPGQPNSGLKSTPDAPPVLLSAQAVNANEVTVVFNETLDSASAVNPAHYLIDKGIGQPQKVEWLPEKNSVKLTLSKPLSNGSFTLQTNQIANCTGNASGAQNTGFQFFQFDIPGEFDVLINEIYADISPSAGLPATEWVELYNRSTKIINLSSLAFSDASGSPKTLPSYTLEPDSFVLLCNTDGATSLRNITPRVLPVSGFPSLNDAGDTPTLSDAAGNIIDRVSFSSTWHTEAGKAGGGWSLERIDPGKPCIGAKNWQSCAALPGGTPAQPNSGLKRTPDAPPILLSAQAVNATEVTVVFNETLDSASAANPAHYLLDKGIGQPQKVEWSPEKNSVKLTLNKPLSNGNFTLQTNQVANCTGNASGVQNTGFQFFQFDIAGEFDVLINEIYADISPSAGLPATEWVELYNRSTKIINLASLAFSDASGSPKTLPSYTLEPDSFVLLCNTDGATSLRNITPRVLPVSGFPSLNDAGDAPTLSDAAGNIIDRVSFSDTWHTEDGKQNGGWSLERIDPGKPCLGAENWQSCEILPGGTPAQPNSGLERTPDAQKPRLLNAFPISPTSLRLVFSEGLDRAAAANTDGYKIVPAIAVASATVSSDRSMVLVMLAAPLQPAIVYSVTATGMVLDCAANTAVTTDTAFVGLPEKPAPLDIVINEVMFNPATGGSRYIEVYNRSKKVFSWENFFIANFYDNPDIVEIARQRLLLPGQYDVFTANPDDIATRFSNIRPNNILELGLPSMDDKTGNVTLYWAKDGADVTVDSFVYDEGLHNALFNTTQRNGVALERISTEEPTNVPANWTSAAPNRTGAPGTPTLPNSQSLNASGASADGMVFLPVERLSPDGDGFEDFLEIQYQLPDPGFAATITIFDSGGIPIRRLGRQELTGIEGFLRWDGEMDNGPRARPGIYVLFVEFFSPDGVVKRTKKAFSVVGKF